VVYVFFPVCRIVQYLYNLTEAFSFSLRKRYFVSQNDEIL
jgi:hypothetical protein